MVLGQGSPTRGPSFKARMRDVLLRTDLWSDQILVLRAVQTLTMLDLQHNCELVWNLGGYTPTQDQAGFEPAPGPPRFDGPGQNDQSPEQDPAGMLSRPLPGPPYLPPVYRYRDPRAAASLRRACTPLRATRC